MYKAIELRPHVTPTSRVMDLIGPSTCWHFDAWMVINRDSELILHVETRAGGRDLLTSHDYHWTGERLCYVSPERAANCNPVTLQDKALWPRFDELNALHWRSIVPMAARIPHGFRSRSVALHYIRAPSFEPIEADAVNMSQYWKNNGIH